VEADARQDHPTLRSRSCVKKENTCGLGEGLLEARVGASVGDGADKSAMCLACSGVSQEVVDRCRRAVSRLGNATMVDTEEQALRTRLTHLVLGSNKRSGKLLLALACGAQVVKPDWIVQCIRWRRWVPTGEHLCEVSADMLEHAVHARELLSLCAML
jgi:BRCA1 C Terminus (BRCT) domain